MTPDDHIRSAQARVLSRMKADPAAGQTTYVTTGRIAAGLACHIEQGRFAVTTDLGPEMGGGDTGPSPGFLARAAIAGCVGIGIKMMAVREGFVFEKMDITVETDFDDAALMGLGSNPAAPLRTRVKIDIDSPDDPRRIADIVDRALECDPWFLALRDAQIVEPLLSVGRVSETAAAT